MNLKKLININFGDLIISITKICMTMIYASMPPFVIQKIIQRCTCSYELKCLSLYRKAQVAKVQSGVSISLS